MIIPTDVSQLRRVNGQKYFLCPVIDLFNNEVISYSVSKNNDNRLVMTSINRIKKCDNELILHSDQGAQFTSHEYTNILKSKNITISMSRKGNCYDNACVESFFSHFKDDFLHSTILKQKRNYLKILMSILYTITMKEFN